MATPIDLTKYTTALTASQNNTSKSMKQQLLSLARALFDENASLENRTHIESGGIASQLYTEGCDDEQIWQQIDQQQRKTLMGLTKYKRDMADQISQLKDLQDQAQNESESDIGEESGSEKSRGSDGELEAEPVAVGKKRKIAQAKGIESSGESDVEDEVGAKIQAIRKSSEVAGKKYKKHYLNEGFFNIHEMHEYLDVMERKEEQPPSGSDDEALDLFTAGTDSAQEEDAIYMADFEPESQPFTHLNRRIDVQKYIDGKESDSNHDGSDSGEDMAEIFGGKVDPSKQSATEKKREKQKKKVKDLEELNLAEKPWQLKGETNARARPENSLLSEAIDFDTLAKSAPVITNDVTMELEDLIKSRIRDLLFDDVERKVKPREDPYEYRKNLALNSEKSQLSLAQIYEKDYLLAKTGADALEDNPDSAAHQKIKAQMTSLFNKLDALTNYTFVPRPAAPEIQFIQNRSTVKVEEAGPLNMGDGGSLRQLAPEEVSNKTRLDGAAAGLKSREERTAEEKRREVRLKKTKQKARAQVQREKQTTARTKPAVHAKNQKLTSTKFFGALEEEKILAPIREKQNKQKRALEQKKAIAKLKL